MRLLEPYDLAGLALPNRVVMAPLTRSRTPDDIADAMTATYYGQRASAGLIISEGTPISREGQGYLFNPGIFSPEQIAGWRKTTTEVHAAGGRIFAQLWHVGRVSHVSIQPDGRPPISSTDRIAKGARAFGYTEAGEPGFVQTSRPRALATDEVGRLVDDFARAAANAIDAGFDGVELHGAGGYVFEQFLNPGVNDRTDRYAADTMSNRLRFTLEVVDAVSATIGGSRVGIRFTPFGQLFDMPGYAETGPTYRQLGRELHDRRIAYMHFMDQSGFRLEDMILAENQDFRSLLDDFRSAYAGTIILAGGLTKLRAEELIRTGVIDLAAFGQPFIANPDLVDRFRYDWPLAEADRSTYYGGGAAGYIDYPSYLEDRGVADP
jgi:2,4-dienoyl-CoA reductase-like NADH-dependent reductase (Old Yellow Enzyme family)